MDGFTPSFFLQLIIALGSGAVAYGVMKADLKNMIRSLDEERRLREEFGKETDESIHDIRNDLASISGRISRQEGANDLAERIATAVSKR